MREVDRNAARTAIENILDRTTVPGLLNLVVEICDLKAEHILVNWQDRALARTWTKTARRVEKLSTAIAKEV